MSNVNSYFFGNFYLAFCPILIQCFHFGSRLVAVGFMAEVGAKCL